MPKISVAPLVFTSPLPLGVGQQKPVLVGQTLWQECLVSLPDKEFDVNTIGVITEEWDLKQTIQKRSPSELQEICVMTEKHYLVK